MTGSLLITFDGYYPQFNQRGFEVTVNGQVRYVHYYSSNNLYTTFLNVGDVVTINNFNTQFSESFDVTRKDYTTDDEGGDRGIKDTFITGVTGTNQTITFTASTRADAYDFYYVIDSAINDCFSSGGVGFRPFSIIEEIKYKNNKTYIGGSFTFYNNVESRSFIILNEDGSINTNVGTGFNNTVETIQILDDNKILVGGNFTSYSGTSRNRIIKLNSDCTIDSSFTIGTGFSSNVIDIELQSDGKIICAGQFTGYSGTNAYRIIRLNSGGTIDTSFSGVTINPTGSSISIQDVDIQNDGKLLLAGGFNWANNNNYNGLVRLNSDGSIDNTFTSIFSGLSSVGVIRIKQLSDGKILVGGTTQMKINSINTNVLMRLNSDGSLDSSFNFISTNDESISDFIVLDDGNIIAYVSDNSGINTNPSYVKKLNSDGSIYSDFNIISLYIDGFNNQPEALCIKPNLDILIGGYFINTSYGAYQSFLQVDKYGNNRMCQSTDTIPTGATFYYDINNINSYPSTGSTLFDLTSNGYNATLFNNPSYTSIIPKYLNFDGSDDYGNVSNALSYGSNTGNFTIGGWFKWSTANLSRAFIARGRDGSGAGWSMALGTTTSNLATIEIVTTPNPTVNVVTNSITSMTNNRWYNIMGTWESGVGLKIYINGVLEGTTLSSRTTLRSSSVFWDISRINTGYSNVDISKIIVYHQKLNDTQITQFFNATKNIYGY